MQFDFGLAHSPYKQRWNKPGLLASGKPAQLTSRGKFLRSRGITLHNKTAYYFF